MDSKTVAFKFQVLTNKSRSNPEILLQSISRYYGFLPTHSRRPFLRGQPKGFMKKIGCKTSRLRLDATSYRELHRQVLERDGWRCQVCGSMQHLQVHHRKLRSQAGVDDEQNLITLCSGCHAQIHTRGANT